jgi:hypothetical protein
VWWGVFVPQAQKQQHCHAQRDAAPSQLEPFVQRFLHVWCIAEEQVGRETGQTRQHSSQQHNQQDCGSF